MGSVNKGSKGALSADARAIMHATIGKNIMFNSSKQKDESLKRYFKNVRSLNQPTALHYKTFTNYATTNFSFHQFPILALVKRSLHENRSADHADL